MSSASGTLTSLDLGGSAVSLAPALPPLPADVPPALMRRLVESFGMSPYDQWLTNPPYAQFDGAPNWPAGLYRGATGTVADRRAGKDLPQYWSEQDLLGYRTMSRWLWDTNPFMIGFGRALTDYHIGKGWQWQACRKGQKKQAYATGAANSDALVEKAQNILDAWRDRVNWPLRSREGFRRLRRDGEVIQRFFRGSDGIPEVRWVNSEQVGSPTGDTSEACSFGVETDEGDSERVRRVYIRDHDGDGSEGKWVNADPLDPTATVVMEKVNTDGDVKRGLPDSFSVHEPLDECRKLVRNMVVVACAQAAIAWREAFPNASQDQIRAMIPTGAPRHDVPAWANGGQTIYSEKMAAGTVLRTEGSRVFEPGPVQDGVPSFVEAEQAALRMCCVRWGFPPYLTAKADDINFASSLTAGSPFAVAIEGGQVVWGVVERRTASKVLDMAAAAGLLTWEERRQLDAEVIAPTVAGPEPGAETQRNAILLQNKIIDPYTWMQREGLDPAHIEANWIAYNQRNSQVPGHPGDGGAMLPGEPPPDSSEDPPSTEGDGLREGEWLSESFTGVKRDSLGRMVHFVDGKRVAAGDKAGQQQATAAHQQRSAAVRGKDVDSFQSEVDYVRKIYADRPLAKDALATMAGVYSAYLHAATAKDAAAAIAPGPIRQALKASQDRYIRGRLSGFGEEHADLLGGVEADAIEDIYDALREDAEVNLGSVDVGQLAVVRRQLLAGKVARQEARDEVRDVMVGFRHAGEYDGDPESPDLISAISDVIYHAAAAADPSKDYDDDAVSEPLQDAADEQAKKIVAAWAKWMTPAPKRPA